MILNEFALGIVINMNLFWSMIIISSILFSMFTGNMNALNLSIVSVGEDALNIVLPMIAITSFFSGLICIAHKAGCIAFLERILRPLLCALLPDISHDHETLGYVASNIVINMFGLGSAATPAGLKAIEGMQKHNKDKEKASRSMVTFLVLNTGGVTIFPTSIIAMRVAYDSIDPTTFVPYAVIATCCASLVGLCVDRWWNYGR